MSDTNAPYVITAPGVGVNTSLTPITRSQQAVIDTMKLLRFGGKPFTIIVQWDGSAYKIYEANPPRRVNE